MRVYTSVDILQKAITESHPFRDFMSSAPLIEPHPKRQQAWILQGTIRSSCSTRQLRRQLDEYASCVEIKSRNTEGNYPCTLTLYVTNIAILERVVYLRGIGLRQTEYNRRIAELKESNKLPPGYPLCPNEGMLSSYMLRRHHRYSGLQQPTPVTYEDSYFARSTPPAPHITPTHKDNVTAFPVRSNPKNEKPGT